MINIELIQKTAESLMAKAAIEIPDDYLTGLQKAANDEDGDLSSFVLEAMLENYVAAKEDRRAMCGDTGCPRWYVKMGNESQIDGGPDRARGGPCAVRRQMPPNQYRFAQTEFIPYGEPTMIIMLALARQKSNMVLSLMVIGLTLSRFIKVVFSALIIGCCSQVTGLKALNGSILIRLSLLASAALPASQRLLALVLAGRKIAVWFLENALPVFAWLVIATPIRKLPRLKMNSKSWEIASAWVRWDLSANPW
jgi:hypothetical protein